MVQIFTDELVVGGDAYGANFGDWNGDGQMDIAGCSWDDGADAWLLSSLQGTSPIADAGSDRTVDIGVMVTLDGSGSWDPDGEIMEWDWECTSHDVDLEDVETSSPSFTPSEEGIYVFNLRVMDDDDEWSQTSTVRITVIDPTRNIKPMADAGDPDHVTVGDLVELDGSGSNDPDGEIVDWEWTCTSHGNIDIENADTVYPSFTPDEEGTYKFRLIVTDDDGDDSDPDQVTVEASYQVFYPRLGPFNYENGEPLSGADVILTSGSDEKRSITDENGYATFGMGLTEGTYSCVVEKDGEVPDQKPFDIHCLQRQGNL